MTSLAHLNLGLCSAMTPEGLTWATHSLTSLQYLSIDGCDHAASALTLGALRRMPCLVELSARNIKCLRRGAWELGYDEQASADFPAVPVGVTKLLLDGSYGYGESGAEAIKEMIYLRHLDLGKCNMQLFHSGTFKHVAMSAELADMLPHCQWADA